MSLSLMTAPSNEKKIPPSRGIEQFLAQSRASGVDGGPTLNQQWFTISCLLGVYFV